MYNNAINSEIRTESSTSIWWKGNRQRKRGKEEEQDRPWLLRFLPYFFLRVIYGRERRICFCWDLFLFGFFSSFGGLLLHFFCLMNCPILFASLLTFFVGFLDYSQFGMFITSWETDVRSVPCPVKHQSPFTQPTALLGASRGIETDLPQINRTCFFFYGNELVEQTNARVFTSNVQRPRGSSPHVCVVMNGHLVNPSRLSSSFGRRLRIMDL